MSRPSILILLGLLTMLVPFSGLPSNIRTFLLVIFGAYVLGIGISLRTTQQEIASLQQPDPPQSPPSTPILS